MDSHYPFLKDELALIEIRKHKWIESEKAGREIGFATAATEWIQNYGYQWKQFRLKEKSDLFLEKRMYRRFTRQWPLTIKQDGRDTASVTHDVSLPGFACLLEEKMTPGMTCDVVMTVPRSGTQDQENITLHFSSRVMRVSRPKYGNDTLHYKTVMSFTESLRDFLRAQFLSLA